MTTSKTIAGLIGPTLVAMAAGMLLNIGSVPYIGGTGLPRVLIAIRPAPLNFN